MNLLLTTTDDPNAAICIFQYTINGGYYRPLLTTTIGRVRRYSWSFIPTIAANDQSPYLGGSYAQTERHTHTHGVYTHVMIAVVPKLFVKHFCQQSLGCGRRRNQPVKYSLGQWIASSNKSRTLDMSQGRLDSGRQFFPQS